MGSVLWRDFFTHKRLLNPAQTQSLEVPLGSIGLHIRSGTVIVLYQEPGQTIACTRRSDIILLISLSPETDGVAYGRVYLDDGESQPPTPYREVSVFAEGGRYGGGVRFVCEGTYVPQVKLQKVTVLVNDVRGEQGFPGPGITEVRVGGETWRSWSWDGKLGRLVIEKVGIDLGELTPDAINWR